MIAGEEIEIMDLEKLSEEELHKLVSNSTNIELLLELIDNNKFIFSIAENWDCPPSVLDYIVEKIEGDYILEKVAKNRNTSTETLEKLVEKGGFFTVRAVANHPRTLPKTLSKLSKSSNHYMIRIAAIANVNIPKKVLKKLGRLKHDSLLRATVAFNPKTPAKTLIKLYQFEEDVEIVNIIEENSTFEAKLRKYAKKQGIEDAYDLPIDWLKSIFSSNTEQKQPNLFAQMP